MGHAQASERLAHSASRQRWRLHAAAARAIAAHRRRLNGAARRKDPRALACATAARSAAAARAGSLPMQLITIPIIVLFLYIVRTLSTQYAIKAAKDDEQEQKKLQEGTLTV